MDQDQAKITVDGQELSAFVGERLDVLIAAKLQRSRNHAQLLLKQGLVQLEPHPEKAKPSYRLHRGDTVSIHPVVKIAAASEPAGEAIPLDVIYEDDDILALNKQPGLVVHPGSGHRSGTLVNALIHHRGTHLAQRGGKERLGLVHRLDKDTSGLPRTSGIGFRRAEGAQILSSALLGFIPADFGRMPRSDWTASGESSKDDGPKNGRKNCSYRLSRLGSGKVRS
jgi:ribosomal protein S4